MARNSIIGWIVKKLKGNMALVEDSTTASQNISANKYVVFQGVLCTADAAISQGDTLATSGAGKNLTEVTGGGFNELNDHIATFEASFVNFSVTNIAQGQAYTDGFLYGRVYLVTLSGSSASGSAGSAYLFFPGYTTSKLTAIVEGNNTAAIDSSAKNRLNYTWNVTANGGGIYRLV